MNHLWDGTASKATRTAASFEPDGAIRFKTAAGPVGTLKPHPEHRAGGKLDKPMELVQLGWDAMNGLADAVAAAKGNDDLSITGRQNAVITAARNAFASVSVAAVDLQVFRRSVDLREQRLFSVPELNPAAFGLHLRDWELRTWFSGLPTAEQASVLAQGQEQVMVALQRGPVPQSHAVTKLAKEIWERTRRESNVTESEAIDAQRAAADWAFEQLALIANITRQLAATWGEPLILEKLLQMQPKMEPAGYSIFGFTERQAATVRRQQSEVPA